MKTAIIYYSKHHGNTKKVIDAIAKDHDITLIDAANNDSFCLSDYDLISFASGIYYSKFHQSVLKFAENNLPFRKKVFFLYTYGSKKESYTKAIKETVLKKSADILGEYGCFGFDTFGPFKLIGGIAKGHPDQSELSNAVKFYNDITRK